MNNIKICHKIEALKNISPNTIVIFPRNIFIDILSKEEVEKHKRTLESIKEISPKEYKEWFNVSISNIEIHEISKIIMKLNRNIKIIEENPVSLDLIESFLKAKIIPVLII